MRKFELIANGVVNIFSIGYIVSVLCRRQIVHILNARYHSVYSLLPMLLLVPYFYTVSEVTGLGIGFSRKTFYSNLVALLAGATNFALGYALIPKMGATGAAIGVCSCYLVYYLLRSYFSRLCGFALPYRWHGLICVLLLGFCLLATTTGLLLFEWLLGIGILALCSWKLLADYRNYKMNPTCLESSLPAEEVHG